LKHFYDICDECEDISSGDRPLEFVFFLCPGFSLLDLASAIEPLVITNRLAGVARYKWRVLSEDGGEVKCTNGILYPTDGKVYDTAPFDRMFVCAFEDVEADKALKIINWIRRRERNGTHFGALGTGAMLLVRAGVVGKRDFTLHWSVQNSFSEMYPNHKPISQIYTLEDRLITCAGGQSVSDMMLSLIVTEQGRDIAAKVADYMIGGSPRSSDTPQRLNLADRYGTRNDRFLAIVNTLEADDTCELTIDDLVRQHSISRRQLERLIKRYGGTSPARFVKQMRLEKARELLEKTTMSVLEVTVACGFGSVANFSKSFSARYNCRPSAFRK
jgi:transcriptional regulator GlxA family with amidase domain